MNLYPKLIIDALSTVRYPGENKSIVELGMVQDDLRINGNSVSFSILFPKNPDPFSKSVIKAAESVSLSPNLISNVEMVSFSLTIGITPSSKSCSKVLWSSG